MAYGVIETISHETLTTGAAQKTGRINLVIGILCLLAGVYFGTAVLSVAAGYIVGTLNMLWLMRIASKGITMTPDRAAKRVARSYYVRFAATVLVFVLLISKGLLNPWLLMAGFSLPVFSVIGVMIYTAREET